MVEKNNTSSSCLTSFKVCHSIVDVLYRNCRQFFFFLLEIVTTMGVCLQDLLLSETLQGSQKWIQSHHSLSINRWNIFSFFFFKNISPFAHTGSPKRVPFNAVKRQTHHLCLWGTSKEQTVFKHFLGQKVSLMQHMQTLVSSWGRQIWLFCHVAQHLSYRGRRRTRKKGAHTEHEVATV